MNWTRRALLWPLLAAASFIGMDAAVMAVAPHHDSVQLTFLRLAGGSLVSIALLLRR